MFVRPKGVHIVHTFVHGRLFGLHFGPFLMVLPTPLHAVFCSRRHDFAARVMGFLGRSGFSGNFVCSPAAKAELSNVAAYQSFLAAGSGRGTLLVTSVQC